MNNESIKHDPIFFGFHLVIGLFWLIAVLGVFFVLPRRYADSGGRVINVLTWSGMFDSAVLTDFSKETGIRVNLNFYTDTEELLVLLKAQGGRGYDLVISSDYAVKILRERNLIKKSDPARTAHVREKISPLLTGYSFDPQNEYALPYTWEVFGFGYDKNRFKIGSDNIGWDAVFDDAQRFKIGMVNDSNELIILAAYYLYGPSYAQKELTCTQQSEIADVLIRQKYRVEAYTDSRPDYLLLTKSCPLVVASSAGIMRGMEHSPEIGFVVPGHHVFISVEHYALPVTCAHDDAVYEFIDYMYQPTVFKRHFRLFASLPASSESLSRIVVPEALARLLKLPRSEFEKRVLFFAPIMSEQQVNDLWIDVKSR